MLPHDRRHLWMSPETEFAPSARTSSPPPPNVVVILADDLGAGDLGCYGSLNIRTPHLDHLAREGLRFTDGYSTAPTCSPTRIALYTGRYPHRLPVGMEEPLVSRNELMGIPHEHPTLPRYLRDNGYKTAMFGKWHCGWLPWFSPIKIGFETFFGNLDGAMDYFSHIDSAGLPDLYEGEVLVEEVGYYSHLITERSIDFIEENSQSPFYLQVNFTSPHWPWEGPHDEDMSSKVTEAMRDNPLTALFHFEGGSLAKYAELVEDLDSCVGDIMRCLDTQGLSDNTIVVFMSDNGGERFSFMWPFVGEKGDLEEGGIRVPFIVRWPSVIPPATVSGVAVDTMDITSTILDAAGVTPAGDFPLDGQSLLSWLLGEECAPSRDLLWRTQEQGAIRRGRFKLLIDRSAKPLWLRAFKKQGARMRLIDVVDDARERKDLSSQHKEEAKAMLETWMAFDREMLPYDQAEASNGNHIKSRID